MPNIQPLPVDHWPEHDRQLWLRATTPARSLFDEAGRGAALSAFTRRNYARAHGAWLAHLEAAGDLDQAEPPARRATPERLDAWVRRLRALARAPGTIRQYLVNLHAFLRLVEPEVDLGYILKPGGRRLSTWLPVAPKPFPPLDTEDLLLRVRELHRDGLAAIGEAARRVALRDAALMALLLRRAPRVGSLAAMRLGIHLRPDGEGGFTVHFPPGDTKARREIAWPLDADCARLMADYLALGRPLFPRAEGTDALWLGEHGAPLNVVGLSALVQRRTRDWLGTAVGPHTARKWLRATAARRSPEAAFDAATVCGHSPAVSLRHYAEAVEVGAAARHGRRIAALRRQTAGLAARSWAGEDGR